MVPLRVVRAMEYAMPHLLFYAAAAGVAAIGYRAFKRAAERVHKRHEEAVREAETGASGTLVRDPQTGRYRVNADQTS